MENRCACLIMAAGSGSRMNSIIKKQFIEVGGMPILARTIKKFDSFKEVDLIIIVAPKDDIERCWSIANEYCINTKFDVVEGGKERYNSVYNGLRAAEGKCDYIMIQDGVRPFVSEEMAERVLSAAKTYGACVPAVPVKDTIKSADSEGFAKETLNRSELWAVQTPQTFRYDIIRKAYDNLSEKITVTDDASVAELYGVRVKIVMGSYDNIKITTNEDLITAEAISKKEAHFEDR